MQKRYYVFALSLIVFVLLVSGCIESGSSGLSFSKGIEKIESVPGNLSLKEFQITRLNLERSVSRFSIALAGIEKEWLMSSEEGALEEVLILEGFPSIKIKWMVYKDPYKTKYNELSRYGTEVKLNLSTGEIRAKELESGGVYRIVSNIETYTFAAETGDIKAIDEVAKYGTHREVVSSVFVKALENSLELL